MISRWYGYKDQAVSSRYKGESIREIEKKLKIPRSTLSGWFGNIKLTADQRRELNNRLKLAAAKGRTKAVLWHNK